jgi:alpha-mannosidase
MYTGQFPLPEATLYSRALRHTEQADTHDLGVVNMATVEPGLGQTYVFDYAVRGTGVFDEVAAWRFGAEFNLPLREVYVDAPPAELSRGFFAVDRPNVQIVSVKPIADTVQHGEVGATPLDPRLNRVYVVRLQEFAGRAATAQITLPVKIKSAARMNLTEDVVLENLPTAAPLTVKLGAFETATIRVELEPDK